MDFRCLVWTRGQPRKYDFSAPPPGHTCSPIHGQGETSCMKIACWSSSPNTRIPNTPNNMPTMPVLQYSTQFTERVKRVFSALRCQVMVARSCMRHHPLDCGDSSLPVRDLWPSSRGRDRVGRSFCAWCLRGHRPSKTVQPSHLAAPQTVTRTASGGCIHPALGDRFRLGRACGSCSSIRTGLHRSHSILLAYSNA